MAFFGPTLVKEYIDKEVEAAKKRFEAELESALAGGCFVTLRINLATGRPIFTRAPGQGEHRIILDTSSGNKLAAYRGAVVMSAAAKSRTPLHFVIGEKAHPSETTEMFLDLSQRSPVEVKNSRPASGGTLPIVIKEGFGTTILSTGRDAAYWLGYLKGRGQSISVSRFRGEALPAAFSRRSCLTFAPEYGKAANNNS